MRLFILLGIIGLSFAFGADNDFQQFDNIVSGADKSAKSAAGIFGTWFIGLLPIVGLAVGIFGGMKYLKKHSNGQEENFAKELGYGGLGAFLGLLVAMIFITAIGAGLMGDSGKGFSVLTAFWEGILLPGGTGGATT